METQLNVCTCCATNVSLTKHTVLVLSPSQTVATSSSSENDFLIYVASVEKTSFMVPSLTMADVSKNSMVLWSA